MAVRGCERCGVALGFLPFSIPRITLVFFSLPLQVKPQKRKELCDGREGQTAYYVERKALRCGARKATLLHDEPDRKSFVSDGDSRENPKSGVDLL